MTRRLARRSGRRHLAGLSLVELTVSIVIAGFILGFTSYLIFMVARNSHNVHDQVISQNNATMAGERAVMIMRQASSFSPWPGDIQDENTNVFSRMRIHRPATSGTTVTGALCYNPKLERIEYYEDVADLSFSGTVTSVTTTAGRSIACPVPEDSSTPDLSWGGQTAFFVSFESQYHVTMHLEYAYSGFALTGAAASQRGQFVTDIIARNHYLDKDIESYGEDATTASPALLPM